MHVRFQVQRSGFRVQRSMKDLISSTLNGERSAFEPICFTSYDKPVWVIGYCNLEFHWAASTLPVVSALLLWWNSIMNTFFLFY